MFVFLLETEEIVNTNEQLFGEENIILKLQTMLYLLHFQRHLNYSV